MGGISSRNLGHPSHTYHSSRDAELAADVQPREGVIGAVEAPLNDGLGGVPQTLEGCGEKGARDSWDEFHL